VLTDDEMAHIAEMDTGASLFFDHRDPGMVSRLGNARVD
jgi:2,5-diketo-D-gluconate reductase A